MTHMLGFEKALPYLLEGKKLRAAKALSEGLVDELVENSDELVSRAQTWILENSDKACQPWDQKGYRLKGAKGASVAQTLQVAPYMVMQKTRGLLPAPERILATASEALAVDFDTALRIESRNFVSLVVSPVAKNMISAFFFQLNKVNSGGSRPKAIAPTMVKKLGVIGAGMMGQGIANVAAMAGIEVVLKDVSLEAAEKGKAYSAALLDKAISRGRD